MNANRKKKMRYTLLIGRLIVLLALVGQVSLAPLPALAAAQPGSTSLPLGMPPNPRLLDRIKHGEVKLPRFMTDRAWAASVGIEGPAKAPPGVQAPQAAPLTGTIKMLAVAVDFSDNVHTVTASYFDSLLFALPVPGPGSMRDYYNEVSYGQIDFVTVNLPSSLDWQRAPQTYAYYVNHDYGEGTYPQNAQKLAEDVFAAIDSVVDFSQYDNNHDNIAEPIVLIHAGPGAEVTGSLDDMWSFSWSTPTAHKYDGVWVYKFTVQPEYMDTVSATTSDETIGVYAHEIGHGFFGVPDTYDTDYSSEGVGNFDLMAGGSWMGPGDNGSVPAWPSAWIRQQMGIVTPTNITTNVAGRSIPQAYNNPPADGVLKLSNANLGPQEYFLLENRQKTVGSYDQYIPGSGLLIWHIDEAMANNTNECYLVPQSGCGTSHYKVALEQADGRFDMEKNVNRGDAGDPYPGTTNNHNYNSTTLPESSSYYTVGNSCIAVNNISSSGVTMTADLNVSCALPNHTVTFNSNGGTGTMNPQTANVATALTLNSFTRLGYSFSGWNTLANGTGTAYANGATYQFTADITLYAQWTALPNHTVAFYKNGGTGSMSNQTANVPTALKLNAYTRTGYSFSGWNTLANGTGTAYADGAIYSFAADIGLYAQWTALPNHTVTFNANGGVGSMSNQTANVPTALKLNAYTRTGYSFSGWNTKPSGTGTAYADGAIYSFAADIGLYAQWTVLPNHTVAFNANGGVGSMSNQTANVPTALKLNAYTRTGYSFSGWNTLANGLGTAYADGAIYSFAADITLYAQWSTLPNHTVTFDSNGGSGSMTAQTTNIPTALTLNTFTRNGYNFAGWNTAANGSGTDYADGAIYSFAADITLYAQWSTLPNHTVTFDANGGSGSMNDQTTNIPTALTLNTFTRSGYNFAGWNTAANGSGTDYADGAIYSFAADITLYAQWTVLPNHTVAFYANGGTGSMSPQITNVPTALTLNSFTRLGYSFSGWNTAANGSGTDYADGAIYSFAADITLYAQWMALPNYTVFLPLILR